MRSLALALALLTACSAIACADQVLVDFMNAPLDRPPTGWKLRGTNGYASSLTVIPDGDDVRAAALDYDFSAPNVSGWLSRGARKTVIMGTWLRIPDEHWVLEIELTGDGSGHGLVVSVGEAREWFNFDLGSVDFDDRRTLRLDLGTDFRDCAGPQSNGWLEPPLWLASLNLEQAPGAPETGRIIVHGISALDEEPRGLSALCARWYASPGGVFTEREDASLRLGFHNIAQEAIGATATWRLRGQDALEREVQQRLEVAAQAQAELSLPIADLPVGYYDAAVELAANDQTRSLRTAFAVVPEPPEREGRIGAGPVLVPAETEESIGVLADSMLRLGARWTVAEVDFRAFDGGTNQEYASMQREVLATARAHGLAVCGSFAAMPPELSIDAPDLSLRCTGALRRAAEYFGAQTTSWAIGFPRYQPDAMGLPMREQLAAFASLLEEAAAEMPDYQVAARLTAAELMQWQAQGAEVAWPEGVGVLVEDSRADILQRRIPKVGVDGEAAVALPATAREVEGATVARRHAEGLAWTMATAAFKLPDARLMYTPLRTYSEPGALLTSDGTVTPVGLAFAICAGALDGAEPEREFTTDEVRGWLFTRGDERVAFVWPTRMPPSEEASGPVPAQQATLPIEAIGAVRHFSMTGQYDDLPEGATAVTIRPGANVLVGEFGL